MSKQETLKIMGEIVAATIVHMAEESKCSVDSVLKAIAEGGAARVRFNNYMDLAQQTVDEALANAQLFAAAPDLLMACKMALVQLNGDDPKWIGVTIVTLQDAITKAEGRDE